MLAPQQDLEQEIERLVRELEQIIRSADPETNIDKRPNPFRCQLPFSSAMDRVCSA